MGEPMAAMPLADVPADVSGDASTLLVTTALSNWIGRSGLVFASSTVALLESLELGVSRLVPLVLSWPPSLLAATRSLPPAPSVVETGPSGRFVPASRFVLGSSEAPSATKPPSGAWLTPSFLPSADKPASCLVALPPSPQPAMVATPQSPNRAIGKNA